MSQKFSFVFSLLALSLFSCKQIISPQWESFSSPENQRLQKVWFVNENEGVIVGGERFTQDLILTTNDGGQTWERRKPQTAMDKIVFDVEFQDELQGWACGLEGKLLNTVDGGENWVVRQLGIWQPIHAIEMPSDSVVMAVGGIGYSEGIIYRSSDRGKNWALLDTLPYEFRDIVFADANTGFICGYSLILKSTDAGRTWDFTPAKGEFFSSMDFPTSTTGYAVGRTGTILKTLDAGESWDKLRDGNNPINPREYYNQVVFLDEDTGYIVGDNGLIKKTVDGGDTWSKFDRDTKNDLFGIHLFREGFGVIVGDEGTILRFEE